MRNYLTKNNLFLILLVLITFSFSSCETNEDPEPEPTQDYQIIFWSDFRGEPIDVYVNDSYVGTITAINNSAPNCDSSGSVTIDVIPGKTYKLYAKEDDNSSPLVWRGNITMPDVVCYKYNLTD